MNLNAPLVISSRTIEGGDENPSSTKNTVTPELAVSLPTVRRHFCVPPHDPQDRQRPNPIDGREVLSIRRKSS